MFTAPLSAEVYKCNDEEVVHYSTIPCDNQVIDLDLTLDDEPIEQAISQEELFITPVYSGWPNGWKKTKNLKLARFFEVVYEPIRPTAATKRSHINRQKLTNLPQSMSVDRFAISVEDIIESICASAIIYQPEINKNLPETIFYGQYACSYRRDTKQGELGYYKIMRGENSIYMIAIKWQVERFKIEENKPLLILEDKQQKKKIRIAKKYLQNEVKLCRAGSCL